MKKLITMMIMVLCTTSLFAQAPEKFTYQAVVRNASNQLVANAPVGVRVSILQGGVNGTLVYMETLTATTNVNGLITLQIGGGILQQGDFANINWANGPFFLKTETDPAGGSNYSVTSTQQLLSVPYALYAKEAGNVPHNVGELTNDANYITISDIPEIPTVPTNVSAFFNDAGYITMDSVPTNVSAFANDAGYLTSFTETDPEFNAWDKDYNDLINKPTIPTVPDNVSTFVNDAGYITMDSVPTNVSAFTNDAGYLTGFTETDPEFNAWDKDYNDLINKPTIPTVPDNVSTFVNDAGYITMDSVPTNVSAFANDVGYLTGFTETDPEFNAWDKDYNDLINKPTIPTVPDNVSTFDNDAGYITMDSVPTNVSAFANDAGYLTSFTETDPEFNAWDKDYNDLINKPTIPTVPTEISAFANDVGYLTSFTEQQVLSISNDTIFLTGGSFVKLPEGFDGDYNSLTNKPTIPIVPTNVSAFTNDAGYITAANVQEAANIPTNVSAFNNDAGYITMDSLPAIPANVSAFNNDAGYLTGYTETDPQFNAWDKDYNDLINLPQIPQVPANVSAFNNDAGYITSADIPEIPTVPTNVSAFNNDVGYLTDYTETQTLAQVTANGNSAGNRQLKNVSDPTENLDAVNLRTLTSQMNSLQDNFQQQMQQMQQQMSQMQEQIDSLQNIVNSLDTNNNTSGGSAVIDEKSCPEAQTVTDHEGNVYATVQIGNRCWMRDNLRTTTSPSTGTYLIPPAGTSYTYTGKQAFWYNNDSAYYAPRNYGLLYNWNAAVDTFNTTYGETSVNNSYSNAVSVTFTNHRRGICPAGWHLPSDAEWNTMEAAVSGSDWQTSYETTTGYRGTHSGKLAGGNDWGTSSTTGAPGDYSNADRNVSGFSAVPAGYWYGSSFYNAGDLAYFWSSSQYASNPNYAYYRTLYYRNAGVYRNLDGKDHGFSVRCLRDSDGGGESSATLPTVTTSTVSNVTASTATCGGNVTATGGASVTARGVCWSTSQNPTVSNSHTTDGSGTGSFISSITGLSAGTTYYVRAYATNSAGTAYGEEVTFSTLSAGGTAVIDEKSCPEAQTVTDHEGNVYATVQIGNQCWMRDNLRTTTSPSTGTYLIPAAGTYVSVTGKQAFWYYNDSAYYAPRNYGLLYNWNAAVDTFNTAYGETSVNGSSSNAESVTFMGHRRGICPAGWHLPSDAEWTQLTNYVSSQSEYTCDSNSNYIAKALASTEGWNTSTNNCEVGNDPSTNNATGFSAVPAGYCSGSSFYFAGYLAYFWSSSQYGSDYAYYRLLGYDGAGVYRGNYFNDNGRSVRCLRDSDGGGESSATLPTVTTSTVSSVTASTATCGGNVTATGGASVTARGVCWSTSQNPTVSNSHTTDGSGTGSFISSITGLSAGTTYYVRAYATNSAGTAYGEEVTFSTLSAGGTAVIDEKSCPEAQTVTDHEGNVYATVQIGNQCWMRDNLRTTTSPSMGTYLIPPADADYTYMGKQARWFNNDSATYAPMNYGLLYNWNAAVDTFNTAYGETSVNSNYSNAVSVTFTGHRRGICPAGWHLPSDAEWNTMEAAVSGSDWQTSYETTTGYRGTHSGKLAGGNDWGTSSTTGAPGDYGKADRNVSGFSAVPAGDCYGSSFNGAGNAALFWSSSQFASDPDYAYYRVLYYRNAGVNRNDGGKYSGFSVRCLRD